MRRASIAGWRGFTLIEVLIALVIAATALTLGFGAVRGSAARLAAIETRTLTGWACDNYVNELVLGVDSLQTGHQRRVETLLGRDFVLDATIARLAAPARLVVDIRVSEAHAPEVELDHVHVETLVDAAGGLQDASLPR